MENMIEEKEDSISLVNFICTIIRYRKLIICGTVFTALIAFFVFFIYPKTVRKPVQELVNVSYRIEVSDLPTAISNRIYNKEITKKNITVSSIAEEAIANSFIVAEINKNNPIYASSLIDKLQYNDDILSVINENRFEVNVSSSGSFIDVSFVVLPEKVSMVEDFVKEMVCQVEEELEKIIFDKFDLVDNIDVEIPSEILFSTRQDLIVLSIEKQFKDKFTTFLTLNESPFISTVTNEQQWGKRFFTVTFLGIIIFIVIALFINSLRILLDDKKTRENISNAWKTGK